MIQLGVATCRRCEARIPDSAAFCPQCGERFYAPGRAVLPDEVTLEWLADVLRREGHTAEVVDGKAITVRHRGGVTFRVLLRGRPQFVQVLHWWTLRKGDGAQMASVVAKANRANQLQARSVFSIDNDGDLVVSFVLDIGHAVHPHDIVVALERAFEDFHRAFDGAGLQAELG